MTLKSTLYNLERFDFKTKWIDGNNIIFSKFDSHFDVNIGETRNFYKFNDNVKKKIPAIMTSFANSSGE